MLENPVADPAPNPTPDPTPTPTPNTPDPTPAPAPAPAPAPTPEPPKVPEKYEAFKLPEGATFEGPPLETFSALAKEAGLSQELAQKFVDMHLGFLGQQQEGYLAAMQEQEKTWGQELLNDPEIGGAKYDESVSKANRVLKTFDTDGSLFKLISDAMLTKNPTIMKFMVRVGQAIGDDQLVDGKTPKVLPKDQPAYIGVYGSGSPLKK